MCIVSTPSGRIYGTQTLTELTQDYLPSLGLKAPSTKRLVVLKDVLCSFRDTDIRDSIPMLPVSICLVFLGAVLIIVQIWTSATKGPLGALATRDDAWIAWKMP
jgi:hypothetical protein